MKVMAMDTIHERLTAVLKELSITPYQLAKDSGDKPTKLYNILNGKAKPSYDTLEGLVEKYPQINLNWLVTGEGQMFNQPESNARLVTEASGSEFVEYPFVAIKFYASFVDQYVEDCKFGAKDTYRVYATEGKAFKNAVVIEVEGNSMSPRLVHCTKVLAVCIDKGDWCYQSSGVYAVMFKEYFVIKRIKDNELLTKKMLMLHSDNPEAGSMPVQAKDIRGIWKVVKVVEAPIE